jgi:uncharacterized membrane protein YphA (DoxX/SURF4 family)
MTRSRSKRLRLVYWIVTALFLSIQGWAATQCLTEAPRVARVILDLGYPTYFIKILGIAKLLGIAAILTGVFPTLKEWAYAGFTFEVCGAFASHLSAGDSLKNALVPAVFFVVQLTSYIVWKQLIHRRASRRRYGFGLPHADAEPQNA